MMIRGVRGAITVEKNTPEAILSATKELLRAMIEANAIEEEAVASVMFSSTPDLNAAYPARAARDLGWRQTALMGFQEMEVPDGLPRCIRILVHWNTEKVLADLNHIFLRDAAVLRPDLTAPDNLDNNGRG